MTNTLTQRTKDIPFNNGEQINLTGYGNSTYKGYFKVDEEYRFIFESESPVTSIQRVIIGQTPFSFLRTRKTSFEKIKVHYNTKNLPSREVN